MQFSFVTGDLFDGNITEAAVDHFMIFEEADLGLEPVSDLNLTVYPNPFNDKLKLKGVEFGTSYVITDLNGRLISTEEYNGPINTADMSPGVYLINVLQSTLKIVKHHN